MKTRYDDINAWPDAILATKAQSGNEDARESLAARYWHIAAIIARQFTVPGMEQDDKHLECLMALSRSIDEWREGHGASFKTFFKGNSRRRLTDCYREANRIGTIPEHAMRSIDDVSGEVGDDLSTVEILPSKDDTHRDVESGDSVSRIIQHVIDSQWQSVASTSMGAPESKKAIKRYAQLLTESGQMSFQELYEFGIWIDGNQTESLFSARRDSGEAVAFVARIFKQYTHLQAHVLSDLTDGYYYDEIAERHLVTVEVIGIVRSVVKVIVRSLLGLTGQKHSANKAIPTLLIVEDITSGLFADDVMVA